MAENARLIDLFKEHKINIKGLCEVKKMELSWILLKGHRKQGKAKWAVL